LAPAASIRRFGVSTHVYRSQRLRREHLLEIAAFGFTTIELTASRAHFDFHSEAAVADVQQWLGEAGLELHDIVMPAPATADETALALFIARRIPVKALIIQATTPRQTGKLVERLAALAAPLGVMITIDSASMLPIGSVAHFVENADARIGIGLDVASARTQGDLVEAIETVAEHLTAMRVPIDAAIDWASVLTTIQKVGYEGPLVFDLSHGGPAKDLLQQARTARARMTRHFRV
jgi:sugar phosphate isomerase/epimerase